MCIIPWEVLTKHGVKLYAGVYGTRGADTILPTMWAFLGEVLEGAEPNTGSTVQPPSGSGTGIPGSQGPPGADGLPSGCILIWSDSADNIPDGFAVCDGENGTPDLRGRFVPGYNDKYDIGTVGGEELHILNINEMPSHNHNTNGYNSAALSGMFATSKASGSSFLLTTSNTGKNYPHNNMPPYYALCYIMKL